MQFLSDVYLRCADCNGRRYREEMLEIRLEGADGRRASIAEVLDLTVTEALRVLRRRARGVRSGCSRSRTSGSTTSSSASRCRRSRAARRSA